MLCLTFLNAPKSSRFCWGDSNASFCTLPVVGTRLSCCILHQDRLIGSAHLKTFRTQLFCWMCRLFTLLLDKSARSWTCCSLSHRLLTAVGVGRGFECQYGLASFLRTGLCYSLFPHGHSCRARTRFSLPRSLSFSSGFLKVLSVPYAQRSSHRKKGLQTRRARLFLYPGSSMPGAFATVVLSRLCP